MVCESMEMVVDTELGNATLATMSVKGILAGTLFLESFYTIHGMAPKKLQLERFLSLIPIRVLIDLSGKNFSSLLDYERLNTMCEKIQRHKAQAIIKQVRTELETMLEYSNQIAEKQRHEVNEQAKTQMKKTLGQELNRLQALQKINPSIRDEEIAFFQEQIKANENFINNAPLKLQALRVIVTK